MGIVLARQQQTEIRAVEARCFGAGIFFSQFAQRCTGAAQDFIGRFPPGTAIDAGEVSQTQHDQTAAGGRIFVIQGNGETVHEIGAIGQAGQGVERSFAAYLLEAAGFFLKHGLDPPDHHVHRTGEAFQLGCRGFLDTDEASITDGPGLPDHRVKRAFDAAQDLHAEETCQHASQAEPHEQPPAALP